MRSRGTLFWGSLFLTLLLLLPIIGVVQFLSAQRARQERVRQANAAASSVTVEPGAQLTATVLVVVQQEDPGFVLVRLDAPAAAEMTDNIALRVGILVAVVFPVLLAAGILGLGKGRKKA